MMRLGELLRFSYGAPVLPDVIESIPVRGLCCDSRLLNQGDLFFALRSKRSHEIEVRYIEEAFSRGASAVLIEQGIQREPYTMQHGIPFIHVPDLSHLMGKIAALFYDFPSQKFPVFGVTGTNGKTSTVHFLGQLLTALGYRAASIGTLGAGLVGNLHETGYTTPDGLTLQKTLFDFHQQDVNAVVMEVSSHSIQEERISGMMFASGGFTNLSQDHLDFHGDMETYANVKARFFTEDWTQKIVINGDDETGVHYLKLLNEKKIEKPVCVYGLHYSDLSQLKNRRDVRGKIMAWHPDSFVLSMDSSWGKGTVTIPLCGGLFQASNVLLAVSMLLQFGVSFESVLNALPHLKSVPGRMEVVNTGQPFSVVVDYAHTPDALKKALASLRMQCNGKLWCVFGCGGDRDSSKRPEMARIAEMNADVVVVTTDNPRHESPEKIISDVCKGFRNVSHVKIILDRREAIHYALQHLSEKDVLLIAGKGAEQYQQVGDEKIPYSDVEWVMRQL